MAIYNLIYLFHVPLFVLLSGVLWSHSGKTYQNTRELWALIWNRAIRLMLPYYFVALFIMYPLYHFTGMGAEPIGFWDVLLARGLDAYHLWFLAMLFSIDVLAILIRPCLSRPYGKAFVLGTSGILLLLHHAKVLDFLPPLPLQLESVPEYGFYFFLGCELAKMDTWSRGAAWLKNPAVFILISVVALGWSLELYPVLMTIFLVLFCYFLGFCLCRIFPSLGMGKAWRWLSRHYFGMYLLHDMAIMTFLLFLSPFLSEGRAIAGALITAAVISVLGELFLSSFKITRLLTGVKP